MTLLGKCRATEQGENERKNSNQSSHVRLAEKHDSVDNSTDIAVHLAAFRFREEDSVNASSEPKAQDKALSSVSSGSKSPQAGTTGISLDFNQ